MRSRTAVDAEQERPDEQRKHYTALPVKAVVVILGACLVALCPGGALRGAGVAVF